LRSERSVKRPRSRPAGLPPPRALERITISEDAVQRVSELMSAGASLIISDHGLGRETSQYTDFIVVTPLTAERSWRAVPRRTASCSSPRRQAAALSSIPSARRRARQRDESILRVSAAEARPMCGRLRRRETQELYALVAHLDGDRDLGTRVTRSRWRPSADVLSSGAESRTRPAAPGDLPAIGTPVAADQMRLIPREDAGADQVACMRRNAPRAMRSSHGLARHEPQPRVMQMSPTLRRDPRPRWSRSPSMSRRAR